ncbi:hypothetical protein OG601_39085 [Streptomyces sp. NBC_01239]|uniref:hypothetical protein n=1 Tax=Streptomyces sp. NBC_01239 TaxID=2903792 RepID=UPI002252E9B0|nr:hypothetical protein [Streptomyces sp. NBC_01239]MCX4816612.1 hypothetical protein [Streptomyces sp. NBC_01239]
MSAVAAAEVPRAAMYDWERAGMTWLAAALREGEGRVDEHAEPFNRSGEAKRAPDRAFQHAAQVALGTERP